MVLVVKGNRREVSTRLSDKGTEYPFCGSGRNYFGASRSQIACFHTAKGNQEKALDVGVRTHTRLLGGLTPY